MLTASTILIPRPEFSFSRSCGRPNAVIGVVDQHESAIRTSERNTNTTRLPMGEGMLERIRGEFDQQDADRRCLLRVHENRCSIDFDGDALWSGTLEEVSKIAEIIAKVDL